MPQEFLMYKGRPLVRSGETLYYGSMGDKCVAHLQIKSQTPAHATIKKNRRNSNKKLSPSKNLD